MSSYKLAIRCVFVSALCVCGHAQGFAEGRYAEVFGKSNTVYLSHGGSVDKFMWAAADVLESGRQVKIAGRCVSACAIFADLARPNVCITNRAVFGFHLATTTTMVFEKRGGLLYLGYRITFRVEKGKPVVSSDIDQWVEHHGGWTSRVLLMNAKEASAFWPMCK